MELNHLAANKAPFANTSLLKALEPIVTTSVDPANITSCSPQIPPDLRAEKPISPSFLIPLLTLSKTATPPNFCSLCLAMF